MVIVLWDFIFDQGCSVSHKYRNHSAGLYQRRFLLAPQLNLQPEFPQCHPPNHPIYSWKAEADQAHYGQARYDQIGQKAPEDSFETGLRVAIHSIVATDPV